MPIKIANQQAKMGASLASLVSQGSNLATQASAAIAALVQLHAAVNADPACDATDIADVRAELVGFLARTDAFHASAHAAMDALV